MAITDWPTDERPREKLLAHGVQTLSDAELLALFLRVGVKGKSAVDLARDLLKHFGSLENLFHAPLPNLNLVHGMGPAKYCQLQAVLEMARRALSEELQTSDAFTSPAAVKSFLQLRLRGLDHEEFHVLFLNTAHQLISAETLFKGSLAEPRVEYLLFNYLAVVTMQRVISYTRFSSRRQAKGDSYRRQTEMALTWCRDNSLELDTSLVLEDLGESAYSGANAKRGALGVLQRLCQDGKLEPGTILLVEAFDRITRLPLPDAYELLLSLINNGLTIVTLTDRKVWNREGMKSLESFMMSLLSLYRGFQESEYKSTRLRETFQSHRNMVSRQAFGSAPGWLYREDKTKPWLVIEELATVVRKVFEMSAKGYGSKSISRIANEEKWPVPTKLNKTEGRWHAQMPGQILRNRAVLGEHEFRIRTHEAQAKHWHGIGTGMVIPDFYPRIVSDELWSSSRASISTRSIVKRRDTHYYNIFAGLLYCGYCGAPMQRRSEPNGNGKGQTACSDRLAGLTKCPSSAVNRSDPSILDNIYIFNCYSLGTNSGEKIIEELALIDSQIANKNEQSTRIANAIAVTAGSVDALITKAQELSHHLGELQREKVKLEAAKAVALSTTAFDDTWLINALINLYKPNDVKARDARVSLHLQIARLVETIWIWSYDVALIKYKESDVLQVVSLPHKQLPSRANPSAKHHKPPKPKSPPPQPYLHMALKCELIPPEPKKRWTKVMPKKPFLLDIALDIEKGIGAPSIESFPNSFDTSLDVVAP